MRTDRPRLARTGVLALYAMLAFVLPVAAPVTMPPATATAPDGSAATAFPRVANWCPDVRTQPIAEIARYDVIALYDGDRGAIPRLRAENPDIVLLNMSSAVEVHLNHALLRDLPSAWFLTQVGTTLSAPVSAEATTFPVATTTVFRRGQLIVVEEELAEVVSVGGGRIVVRRGVLPERSPAAAHPAGTRVAAVVSNRRGEIEMDISRYCPKVTVETSVGPETWGQYAARLQARRCASADWDGVIADRVEGNESFLVSAGLVQSIDPRRDNTRPTDGYAEFDRAWNAGVRDHLAMVRRLVGPGKIVVSNNGVGNGDLVNGSNLESFPRTGARFMAPLLAEGSYPRYWRRGRDYYDRWTRTGLQPNLSTVMTYDDEDTPTTGDTSAPLGPPDLRKMRFGLGTALMSDGYFSYQKAVWGSRTGLYWFDEYDNGGRGRGYLGEPLGAARLALPALATPDAVGGSGDFSAAADLDSWRLSVARGYAAARALDSGAVRVSVTRSAGDRVRVQLYRDSIAVRARTPYTVSFRARADRATSIGVRLTMKSSPWRDWVGFYDVAVGTEWRTFELSGVSKGDDPSARLAFDLGKNVGTVWLDDVRVQTGSRLDVLRRDFTGGAALVNGSDSTVTVPLGAYFRKIRGTQAPGVNDGSTVRSVTLPPRDGLVLVRRHLTLKGGAATTRDTAVAAASNVPRATRMRFSLDGGSTWPRDWTAYSAATTLSLGAPLPPGSSHQTRTVTAHYEDAGGDVVTAKNAIRLLPRPQAVRLSGSDRYATSIAVADRTHPATSAVAVLASGEGYPDAMCAAPLAAAFEAPLLLTPTAYLRSSVADKLTSLRPSTVFIVGGTAAVSENVTSALSRLSWRPKVIRIGGASRFETAAAVAERIPGTRGRVTRVVIANGTTHTDALLAAPLAAAKGWPILLVKQNELPSATASRVAGLKRQGLSSAVVVGDGRRVSDGVAQALRVTTERVQGADAYELSRAMAAYSVRNGASTRHIAIASGLHFADALSCGPLLASTGSSGSGFGVLLFSASDPADPDRVPSPVSAWLSSRRSDPDVRDVTAVGGRAVVSDGNLSKVVSALD